MREAVIVSTARTPIGRAFRGALNNIKSPTLMARDPPCGATRGRRRRRDRGRRDRHGVDRRHCRNESRAQCGIRGGHPVTAAAQTIDRQCASGLTAIAAAAKEIVIGRR